ncbi:hypothetical protein IFT72_07230 [Frigoribacterium sp. CFBP 8754]|uniref:hypothetical protein n=1 Tax=Frigoribacterium sp. CFBP 8754 TaxID=2775290 RepID=UPI001787794F|nr:hypothetical protein [Frigoribacterium sp. CFBP 8754]MBD8659984.1 hypothetical protein [Frigoribacterium sp. CFBP 8754]
MSSTDGQPPLTRRQVRDLERARQGSAALTGEQPAAEAPTGSAPSPVSAAPVTEEVVRPVPSSLVAPVLSPAVAASAPSPASAPAPSSLSAPSSISGPPASVAEPGQLTRRQLRALRDAEAARGPVPLQAPGPEPRRTLSEALDTVDQIVSPIEGGEGSAAGTSAATGSRPASSAPASGAPASAAPASAPPAGDDLPASVRPPVSSAPSVLPTRDDDSTADDGAAPGPRRTGEVRPASSPAPTSTPTVFPLDLSGERPSSAPSEPVASLRPAGLDPVAPTPVVEAAPASVPEPTGFVPPVGHWTTQVDAPDDESAPGRALGTHTGQTNALILTDQQVADVTGALNATGEIIITGSIDLPRSLGATGSQARIDNSEIDRLMEAGDAESADTDAAPVRASKAISTHTSTRSVVLAAAQPAANRLPLVLGIVGGGVGLGIIGVIVYGFSTGVLGG